MDTTPLSEESLRAARARFTAASAAFAEGSLRGARLEDLLDAATALMKAERDLVKQQEMPKR